VAPIPTASSTNWGTGTGSLEAARGSAHLADGDVVLTGEFDVFGQAWDGSAWAAQTEDKHVWKDGTWRGEGLTGKGWQDAGKGLKAWPTTTWTLTSATSSSGDWTARMWRDDAWSARMWRDDSWTARMWRDDSWSARMWRDQSWS
jgi:serine protease AprX